MVFSQCEKYGGRMGKFMEGFLLTFFSTPQVVKLRQEVICFEKRKTESLGAAWARFMKTVESSPRPRYRRARSLAKFS
jgi:hypothetical protein